MDEGRVCPNQEYGKHIVVRCSGCNSIHSTKNIGDRNPENNRVTLHRSLFDILGCFCLCKDTSQFPLIHDCEIDDNLEYRFNGLDLQKGKHIAKTQKAREVLQSWWKRFADTHPLESGKELAQVDLDDLVKLEGEGGGA